MRVPIFVIILPNEAKKINLLIGFLRKALDMQNVRMTNSEPSIENTEHVLAIALTAISWSSLSLGVIASCKGSRQAGSGLYTEKLYMTMSDLGLD